MDDGGELLIRLSQKKTAAGTPLAANLLVSPALGNHTFRVTRITAYLKNGGTLENAAAMANHASTRTTQLYDRRRDELNLDEVERISI
jgi:integrase